MITKQEANNKLKEFSMLDTIIDAYEEITAMQMRKIRDVVLRSRDFLMEVNGIYQEVKSTYKKDIEKKKKLVRNGKTIYVLLSANEGLSGNITKNTFQIFSATQEKQKSDMAIIGKIGLNLAQDEKLSSYTYFDLPESKNDTESIKKILNHLLQYEKVYICYSKFQNLMAQESTIINITGDIPTNQQPVAIKYIFEPTLPAVMSFFETEIFSSLFYQTLSESELAKYASRMMSLDKTHDTIKNNISNLIFMKQKVQHQLINKKQLAFMASYSLWKK